MYHFFSPAGETASNLKWMACLRHYFFQNIWQSRCEANREALPLTVNIMYTSFLAPCKGVQTTNAPDTCTLHVSLRLL